MRRVTAEQVQKLKVAELGLDQTALDLTSTEAISCALRRAAGFLCPCSPKTLIRAVIQALDCIIPNVDGLRENIEETLEAIIAHGDLLEHRDVASEEAGRPSTFLYAAPPSFVRRESGTLIILGIAPDYASFLPEEFKGQIDYVNHVRRLSAVNPDEVSAKLAELGVIKLSFETWLKAPAEESAAQHVHRLGILLAGASPSLDIPGLSLLDPSTPVQYYRGRWVQPRRQSGRFVGRRSQAYGSDLWCYVEMREGRPQRFLDFPQRNFTRGCDEAWHLQAAIDSLHGTPQRFRMRQGSIGAKHKKVVDFFSPVPMWARRRWDAVGEPVVGSGCLFSYSFAKNEIDEELRLIRNRLWLAELA
jgi:hypothetical protein